MSVTITPLVAVADLLRWTPAGRDPLDWRSAFETHLQLSLNDVLRRSEPDGCLIESLALLPDSTRRCFLRAPAVAMMLRRHVGNQFDDRLFSRLLLAELAAAGLASDLPEALWTARGNLLLDNRGAERRVCTELDGIGIAVDLASPFEFPDDEFGIAETTPYDSWQADLVMGKVCAASSVLRHACPRAQALVTALVEVLALRRQPADATDFYSSTFPGCPGLVRLTNAHLPEAGTLSIIEALVHEAIHCILHVHEELEEPFVRDLQASHARIVSPWTGATIRLQSYIHACAVWYGLYWLWSADGFAAGPAAAKAAFLRQRARRGFRHLPVSEGLAPFSHFLTETTRTFLRALEQRMLEAA